ncbi:hypothetical protein WJ542_03515 [Paraburkholderia sp. B3]|uniref:hypothetical protein n=1 Tax=Paraburkholderia sp. B3 TaxID=3134791 RepID=UPI0039827380
MAQKQKAATRASAAKEIFKPQYSNDAAAQRGRVLEFLRCNGSEAVRTSVSNEIACIGRIRRNNLSLQNPASV